jgi:uncharacterized oxidoreductase
MQLTNNTIFITGGIAAAVSTIETNLLGPVRMTSALVGHLKTQPRAMPLDAFIAQTLQALATNREEALVDIAVPLRNNAGPDGHKLVNEFNTHIAEHPIPVA